MLRAFGCKSSGFPALPRHRGRDRRGPSPRRPLMATIGNFTKSGDRYTGAVRTLTLNVKRRSLPPRRKTTRLPITASFQGQLSLVRGGKRPPAQAASTSRSSSTIRAFLLPSTLPSSKPKARVSSPSSGPAARPSNQASIALRRQGGALFCGVASAACGNRRQLRGCRPQFQNHFP